MDISLQSELLIVNVLCITLKPITDDIVLVHTLSQKQIFHIFSIEFTIGRLFPTKLAIWIIQSTHMIYLLPRYNPVYIGRRTFVATNLAELVYVVEYPII